MSPPGGCCDIAVCFLRLQARGPSIIQSFSLQSVNVSMKSSCRRRRHQMERREGTALVDVWTKAKPKPERRPVFPQNVPKRRSSPDRKCRNLLLKTCLLSLCSLFYRLPRTERTAQEVLFFGLLNFNQRWNACCIYNVVPGFFLWFCFPKFKEKSAFYLTPLLCILS